MDQSAPAPMPLSADAAVGRLQDSDVEALLAAEIVVDHSLAGLGAGGDVVHARTAEPLAGKLLRRDLYDVALGALGIWAATIKVRTQRQSG